MKAKEWVVKFEADASERFVNVLKEFGAETAALVDTRTKTSRPETKFPAAEGAVREQKTKFRAICGRVPTLAENMFDLMLATAIPDFAMWQKAAAQKKAEKPKEDVYHRNFGKQKGK